MRVEPPSRGALRQACILGFRAAKTDRKLRPDVSLAPRFATYQIFAQAHRTRLAQTPSFTYWEEQLEKIATTEAKLRKLSIDDVRYWDAFHTALMRPLANAFWYSWESIWQMPTRYEHLMAQAGHQPAVPPVLRVYHRTPDASDQGEGWSSKSAPECRWDEIADSIFAQRNADGSEELWAMPDAENPFA